MADRMRFGATNYAEDLAGYATWVRAAEASGFELLTYGDSQALWADSFVALTVAATHTTRARLGPMVANPITRHPTVLASGMSALQQLTDGRIVCGIGAGDSALRSIGERPAGLVELETYARAVKTLCDGRPVTIDGTEIRMQWRTDSVPVWMAAGGPRTLELAGQIADGVVLGNGITPDVVADSIARVRAGAESRGRSLDDIELWWLVKPWIAESQDAAWRYLAWTLAGSANHTFHGRLEHKFVPEELVEPVRRLCDRYAVPQHGKIGGRGRDNAQLVEELGLTRFLGERFSVAGPAPLIVERLQELRRIGVTNVLFTLQARDQIRFMHDLRDGVLSRL